MLPAGISRVSISLDGATPEKHDLIRGKGSFQAAMQGIESLRGKVDFQINNTLTSKNESDVAAHLRSGPKSGGSCPALLFPGGHGPGPGGGSHLAGAAGAASHGDRPGAGAAANRSAGHLRAPVRSNSQAREGAMPAGASRAKASSLSLERAMSIPAAIFLCGSETSGKRIL